MTASRGDGGRRGDYMVTSAGRRIWPLDPRPGDLSIEEIAHALSLICRFGGHVPGGHYSVAQHSVYVSRCAAEVRPDLALIALLHDAPEAVLGDVVRPLKRSGLVAPAYAELEAAWMRVIALDCGAQFGGDLPPEVRDADDRVLLAERRDLFAGQSWREGRLSRPWMGCVRPVDPRSAEREFLGRYEMLGARRR